MVKECVQYFSCLSIEVNVTLTAGEPIKCQDPFFILFIYLFTLQMCVISICQVISYSGTIERQIYLCMWFCHRGHFKNKNIHFCIIQ